MAFWFNDRKQGEHYHRIGGDFFDANSEVVWDELGVVTSPTGLILFGIAKSFSDLAKIGDKNWKLPEGTPIQVAVNSKPVIKRYKEGDEWKSKEIAPEPIESLIVQELQQYADKPVRLSGFMHFLQSATTTGIFTGKSRDGKEMSPERRAIMLNELFALDEVPATEATAHPPTIPSADKKSGSYGAERFSERLAARQAAFWAMNPAIAAAVSDAGKATFDLVEIAAALEDIHDIPAEARSGDAYWKLLAIMLR